MGRKPNEIVAHHFDRGQKLENSSNRYSQTCKHCGTHFPKGRPEVLKNHITNSCEGLTDGDRAAIIQEVQRINDQHRQQNHQQPPPTSSQSQGRQLDASQLQQTPSNLSHHDPSDQQGDLSLLSHLASVAATETPSNVIPSSSYDHVPITTHNYAESDIATQYTQPPTFPLASGYQQDSVYQLSSLSANRFDSRAIDPQLENAPSSSGMSHGLGEQQNLGANYFANVPGQSNFNPAVQLAGPMPTAQHPYSQIVSAQASSEQMLQEQFAGPSHGIDPNGGYNYPPALGIGTQSHSPTDDMEVDNAQGQRPSKKARKSKSVYDESQKAKAKNMRQARPCIRCSRLQKSCSELKPCQECEKVKSHKNWEQGCFQFAGGHNFDELFSNTPAARYDEALQTLLSPHMALDGQEFVYISLPNVAAPALQVSVVRVSASEDEPEAIVPIPNSGLEGLVETYLDYNKEEILRLVASNAMRLTLEQAYQFTQGAPEKLSKINQVYKGDRNLGRLIDIWVAVSMLDASRWTIEHYDANKNKLDTAEESYQMLRLKLSACAQSVINNTRNTKVRSENEPEGKGSVLFEFDVSRISTSGHKEFHNLFLGIIIVLSAVERYCHFTATVTEGGVLPDETRDHAVEYARIYAYAVKGISILPPLATVPVTVTNEDGTTTKKLVVGTKTTSVSTGSNHTARTIDHQETSEFLKTLMLDFDELEMVVEREQLDEEGWLWGRILLKMREGV